MSLYLFFREEFKSVSEKERVEKETASTRLVTYQKLLHRSITPDRGPMNVSLKGFSMRSASAAAIASAPASVPGRVPGFHRAAVGATLYGYGHRHHLTHRPTRLQYSSNSGPNFLERSVSSAGMMTQL